MDFASPEKNSDGSYTIHISVVNNLQLEYNSSESGHHTTPPYDSRDLKIYIGQISEFYESYSTKWFSKQVFPTIFLSRVNHIWDTEDHDPYTGGFRDFKSIIVFQEWSPEQIHVTARAFTIHWKLVNVFYKIPESRTNSSSGPLEVSYEQIPLDSNNPTIILKTTLRTRAIKKVREARLLAAISRARSDILVKRYYEKYGTLEVTDSGSVLSSDSE